MTVGRRARLRLTAAEAACETARFRGKRKGAAGETTIEVGARPATCAGILPNGPGVTAGPR